MQTTAIASTSLMKRHRAGYHETYFISKPGFIGRCRRLIETSDWDERLLRAETWLNRLCVLAVVSSVLYLAPVLLLRLLR